MMINSMKANELMIGDWVQFANGTPIKSRINCISPYQRYAGHTDNATWFDSFDDIKPVTLTEDILKTNGFDVYTDIGGLRLFCNGVRIEEHNGNFLWNGILIKYVHELQHAIRLCGFNELADNFKLKNVYKKYLNIIKLN